jgi:hypothetical protein
MEQGPVRDNDHSVCFTELAFLMQWVSLPEDISQLKDRRSKFGARDGEGPSTYSVPYSPRTFARVHFEGPVSTYAVIKALIEAMKKNRLEDGVGHT